MDRYMTALSNHDEGTTASMKYSGQVQEVSNGAKCNILQDKYSCLEIEILDGADAGESGWVVMEDLQRTSD